MTDTTPLTDFVESFKRSLRAYGWSEEKIDSIVMETWTDGQHIRATINFRGVTANTRLPKARQTASGDKAADPGYTGNDGRVEESPSS